MFFIKLLSLYYIQENSSLFVLHSSLHLLCMIRQIISQMWRLVIAYILPSHTHTIDMVVHQGWHTILRRDIGGEDIEMRGIALVPIDDFLSPVAKKISLQIRGRLRPVAAYRISHLVELFSIAQRQSHRLAAVPFLKIRREMRRTTVCQKFILQAAIPVDSEVHCRHSGNSSESRFLITSEMISFMILLIG